MSSEVLLRVPREWAVKLEKLAKEEGITTRGKWAVKARMILKEAIGEEEAGE